jgi:WD40 repeat protein
LRLWDTVNGKLRHTIAMPSGTHGLAFSPDGRTLAVSVFHSGVSCWDVATAKKGRVLADRACAGGVAFTPDGACLASSQEKGDVVLWDLRTGREKRRLVGHRDAVFGLAFSGDGKALATGEIDATIRVWDVASGKELRRRSADRVWAHQAHFIDKGKGLLVLTHGQRLSRWDLSTGKDILLWEDEQFPVGSIAFTADGRTAILASINGPHYLRQIDLVRKKEVVPAPGHHASVSNIAFSPNGKLVATVGSGRDDQVVRLWDTATGRLRRELKGHRGGASSLAISPDGKTLASSDWWGGKVRLWDVPTGRPLRVLEGHKGSVMSVAFSADGKTLASGGSYYERSKCLGQVHLWDLRTGKLLHVREGLPGMVRSVAFSPNGRNLATGSDEIRLWDVTTGTLRQRFAGSDCLAYSPDGRLLASTFGAEEIGVRETRTGALLFRIKAHARVTSIAFSPDGEVLASGGLGDSPVRFWEATDDAPIGAFAGRPGWGVIALTFSPDGRKLASGNSDTTALIWDLRGIRAPAPGVPGREVDLADAWADLGSATPALAYRAVRLLAASPARAVPYLEKRLRPTPLSAGKRLARLVADLDSDTFEERERASAELAKAGRSAELSLRSALKGKLSLEHHRRIEALLKQLEANGYTEDELRPLRAIAVLERINSGAARRLLERLAGGDRGSLLTQDATESLQRLARMARSR